MKCFLWTWLLLVAVLLLISENRAERCRTSSFNNAQLVVYNKDYFALTISVSGCIAPLTLKAIGGNNVRRVLCDDQNIPYLREQAISDLSNLQTIRFERSGITTIESGAFTNLPLLRYVYLTENQIESLNENIFVDVPKLQVLSFHKNNLQHFDKSWLGNTTDLEILDLSYNVIEFISGEAFENIKTLRVLNIEHNNIRQITEKAFNGLLNLESLDLSYNKISRLYDNLFVSTTKLSTLNLFGNSLIYISEKVLHSLRTVNQLIISYNPWQCDCFNKIIDWRDKYKNIKLNIKNLECKETTDISNIAVCVTSIHNESRCVPNPREDIAGVYLSEQPDYHCSLVKEYAKLKERSDPCTTPNGKRGRCVPLDTCKVVFDAATSRNKDDKEFAQKSLCSYDTDTLVCCESPGSIIPADFESRALPITCGLVKEEPKIIGGIVANLGEFPWMAALEYKSKLYDENVGIQCGGSIINNRYVLTAAHCIINRLYELISVRLGEWNITTDPDCITIVANMECADPVQIFQIKEMIPHLFYNYKNRHNDIGLLLLEKEIKFTDYVAPICLPLPNLPSPEVGTLMTMAGWGVTDLGGLISDVLLKVNLPLVSNELCSKLFDSRKETLSQQQLCAGGEPNRDSCQGDSGGPVMTIYDDKTSEQVQWYQEGVSSWGIGCGRQNYPAFYTQTFSYMNWIINVISND